MAINSSQSYFFYFFNIAQFGLHLVDLLLLLNCLSELFFISVHTLFSILMGCSTLWDVISLFSIAGKYSQEEIDDHYEIC